MKERKFSDFPSNSAISFEAVYKNFINVCDILLVILLSAVKFSVRSIFTFSCRVFGKSIFMPFLAAGF